MPASLPTIAIIDGIGKEGKGLALRWAYAGYKIIIGSGQADKAQQAARAINTQLMTETVMGNEKSVTAKQADLSVRPVHQSANKQVAMSVCYNNEGKIMVDATSRVDYLDAHPHEPPCAAHQTQDIVGPTVRVVAAFQNVPAKLLSRLIGQDLNADVFVYSDILEAAEEVLQLVRTAGMRGYFIGKLINAIVVEGLTSILISLNKHYGINQSNKRISGLPDQNVAFS